jgi:hypothetical protein
LEVTPVTSQNAIPVKMGLQLVSSKEIGHFEGTTHFRERAMTLPLQISFRNMRHSAEVEDSVRAEAAKLETFYHRIIGCHVAIELPHRHHKKGKPLHVRIDLNLPGKEIVIKREPVANRRISANGAGSLSHARAKSPHVDLQLVIHDAFKAAGRRVQDFARRRRGAVKRHKAALVKL